MKAFFSFCFHFHLFAPRLSIVEALQYYTIHIHFNCIVLPVILRYGILSERMCVKVSAYVHLKSLALMPPHAIQVSNHFRYSFVTLEMLVFFCFVTHIFPDIYTELRTHSKSNLHIWLMQTKSHLPERSLKGGGNVCHIIFKQIVAI